MRVSVAARDESKNEEEMQVNPKDKEDITETDPSVIDSNQCVQVYDGFELIKRKKFSQGMVKRYLIMLDQDYTHSKVTLSAYTHNILVHLKYKFEEEYGHFTFSKQSSPSKLSPSKIGLGSNNSDIKRISNNLQN